MLDPLYRQGKVGEIMARKSQKSWGFFFLKLLLLFVSASICLVKGKHRASLEAWGRVKVKEWYFQGHDKGCELRKGVQIGTLFSPLLHIFLGIIKFKIVMLPPLEEPFRIHSGVLSSWLDFKLSWSLMLLMTYAPALLQSKSKRLGWCSFRYWLYQNTGWVISWWWPVPRMVDMALVLTSQSLLSTKSSLRLDSVAWDRVMTSPDTSQKKIQVTSHRVLG